jgi:hypothetical protein
MHLGNVCAPAYARTSECQRSCLLCAVKQPHELQARSTNILLPAVPLPPPLRILQLAPLTKARAPKLYSEWILGRI